MQVKQKFSSTVGKRESQPHHEHPLEEGDVAARDAQRRWILEVQTNRVADVIVRTQDLFTLHGEEGDMTVLKRDEQCGEVPGSDLFVLPSYVLGGRTGKHRGGAGFALTRHIEKVFGAPVKERKKQKRGRRKAEKRKQHIK